MLKEMIMICSWVNLIFHKLSPSKAMSILNFRCFCHALKLTRPVTSTRMQGKSSPIFVDDADVAIFVNDDGVLVFGDNDDDVDNVDGNVLVIVPSVDKYFVSRKTSKSDCNE